jgi:aryl-alcohol dehydrogenase-like predicted oxidoreductase
LSGRFKADTKFTGDDHRKGKYSGEGLTATLTKVEKLSYLQTKTMPLAEAALKWTLAHPAVSTTIPGIRNLKQALLNCAAGDGPVLSAEDARKAEELYKSNFGLPVKTVDSDEDVEAVFMSGVRVK